MDISVIIPVYNAAALMRRCLDSILAQKGNYVQKKSAVFEKYFKNG